jgi:5-(carboxyamino)imidazole ribonucleotide mutase
MPNSPLVGIIMGSRSDLKIMSRAAELLTELEVPHEVRVVSAHRTPDWMFEYAASAEGRGLEVIIAGAAQVGVTGKLEEPAGDGIDQSVGNSDA